MPNEPLKQFRCDECGGTIKSPEQGYLQWLPRDEDGNLAGRGFRIVHHLTCSPLQDDRPRRGCYYPKEQIAYDMDLPHFMGADGLVRLMSLFTDYKVKDPEELFEIIRRLHVPHYEEARDHWGKAREDGFFDGTCNGFWPYLQSTLETIIQDYGSEQASAR